MMSEYEVLKGVLKKLKDQKENFGILERFDVDENFVATIAIKKQIAEKPILKHDTQIMHINKGDLPHEIRRMETDNWHCPECDGFVGERVYIRGGEKIHDQCLIDYCSRCGQRIDWSNRK